MTKFGTPIGAGAEVGDREARVGVGRDAVRPAVGGARSSACGAAGLASPRGVRRRRVAAVVAAVRLAGVAGRRVTSEPRPPGPEGRRRRRRPASWSSSSAVVVGRRAPSSSSRRRGRSGPWWCGRLLGGPLVPDSVESRGPEQSGSSRSVSPSPSSSAAFEHCGSAWMSRGRSRSAARSARRSGRRRRRAAGAPAVPATTQAPRTARPIVSRSFRLIPLAVAAWNAAAARHPPLPRRQWASSSS